MSLLRIYALVSMCMNTWQKTAIAVKGINTSIVFTLVIFQETGILSILSCHSTLGLVWVEFIFNINANYMSSQAKELKKSGVIKNVRKNCNPIFRDFVQRKLNVRSWIMIIGDVLYYWLLRTFPRLCLIDFSRFYLDFQGYLDNSITFHH